VDLGGARLDRLRGVGGDVVGGHAELDDVEADVAVPPAVDSGEDDANVVLPGVELEGAVADESAGVGPVIGVFGDDIGADGEGGREGEDLQEGRAGLCERDLEGSLLRAAMPAASRRQARMSSSARAVL
jgi:hypothetical protein